MRSLDLAVRTAGLKACAIWAESLRTYGKKKQAPMHQADYSRRKVLEAATRPATRMHAEEYRCSLSFIQLMSWLMQHSQEI